VSWDSPGQLLLQGHPLQNESKLLFAGCLAQCVPCLNQHCCETAMQATRGLLQLEMPAGGNCPAAPPS